MIFVCELRWIRHGRDGREIEKNTFVHMQLRLVIQLQSPFDLQLRVSEIENFHRNYCSSERKREGRGRERGEEL